MPGGVFALLCSRLPGIGGSCSLHGSASLVCVQMGCHIRHQHLTFPGVGQRHVRGLGQQQQAQDASTHTHAL